MPRKSSSLIPALLLAMSIASCDAPAGRSVRTWIEARDAAGETVAGATVTVDGRPLGMTDHRGLFRVKVRRRVGAVIGLTVVDEEPPQFWAGSFVVGTHGGPAGSSSDRLIVQLAPGVAAAHLEPVSP